MLQTICKTTLRTFCETTLEKRDTQDVSVESIEDEEESNSSPAVESSIVDVNCNSCSVKLFEEVSNHFLILM